MHPGPDRPGPDPAGPIARVLASGEAEESPGCGRHSPAALLPGPLGPLTPDTAVVLPLTVSGRADPIGVLVVGVNPYRPLNAEYRAFLTLVARQFRVALTDAVAYEAQRQRSAAAGRPGPGEDGVLPERQPRAAHPVDRAAGPVAEPAGRRPRTGRRPNEQDLQAAMRAAERLRTMVDALLDFSGAEAGSLNPDRQPTDLADLTAQTCSMFRSAAEHAGLEFDGRGAGRAADGGGGPGDVVDDRHEPAVQRAEIHHTRRYPGPADRHRNRRGC